MLKNKSKKQRLAAVFTLTLAIFVIIGMTAYSVFFRGYALGIPTKGSVKSDFRQYICIHDWSGRSGVCRKCGLLCGHPKYDIEKNCKVCGFHHIHEYENSVCKTCGAECAHENWEKGVCLDCGYLCSHPQWNNNRCVICGMYCEHPKYENSLCVLCGSPCLHEEWDAGICKSCGFRCSHESHDRETGSCLQCGYPLYHDFSGGVCSCGLTPPFMTTQLPGKILEECSRKGAVYTITYHTQKYYENNEPITKNMDIYLPYGYSTDSRYNVLILIHGSGGHYNDWSNNPITVGYSMSNPRNIYDNMIAEGLCKPLIIVSVSGLYYSDNGETESGYKQLADEIRLDILPYVAEHFSTYAAGFTVEDISAARDHFGIGGMGDGAVYAFNSGLVRNYDLFSNFAFISGSTVSEKCIRTINSSENTSKPVHCLVSGTGSCDPGRNACFQTFGEMCDACSSLIPSSNAYYMEISSAEADWVTATAMIYNSLLVLFP